VSFLAFFFIVASLLSFVVAQIVVKRAMEFSQQQHAQFGHLLIVGIALMTISFFLTLSCCSDSTWYLYPFQGLTSSSSPDGSRGVEGKTKLATYDRHC
jgi:heme/copper-type cytochrome/quinol oxidase subunit 1